MPLFAVRKTDKPDDIRVTNTTDYCPTPTKAALLLWFIAEPRQFDSREYEYVELEWTYRRVKGAKAAFKQSLRERTDWQPLPAWRLSQHT